MSNVTVTLTQEESNLINLILEKTVNRLESDLIASEKELTRNGALRGAYGEEVRILDSMTLELLDRNIVLYDTLRDKFPLVVDKAE